MYRAIAAHASGAPTTASGGSCRTMTWAASKSRALRSAKPALCSPRANARAVHMRNHPDQAAATPRPSRRIGARRGAASESPGGTPPDGVADEVREPDPVARMEGSVERAFSPAHSAWAPDTNRSASRGSAGTISRKSLNGQSHDKARYATSARSDVLERDQRTRAPSARTGATVINANHRIGGGRSGSTAVAKWAVRSEASETSLSA